MHQDRCEVWVASLAELRRHQPALAAVLTPDEQSQVAPHADPTTGSLSRAVLRLVLARHLDVPPEEVRIDRTCPDCGRPHGRPRLRDGTAAGGPPPQVSVSHGGDLLVLALTPSGPVGVDVEPEVPGDVVGPELLELTLTAVERCHAASVPKDQRQRVFLHYWTGKEAVLKAVGTGLDLPLHAVTLPVPPAGGPTEVTVPGSSPVRLAVGYLDVGAGHVCALATADPAPDLRVGWLSPTTLLGPPNP